MDKELFLATLGVVHALFGKAAPAPAVIQALWERVADYPDAVLPLVEKRLELEEKLPANLYREFHAALEDWRNRRAVRREAVSGRVCPVCAGQRGFWCWLREPSGRWHHFFAPCSHCQDSSEKARPSVAELRARGVLVMPPGYPGGPTAFDCDNHLGVLWPLETAASCRCSSSPGVGSELSAAAG